jgi:beta-N-acetylhexosaminidase
MSTVPAAGAGRAMTAPHAGGPRQPGSAEDGHDAALRDQIDLLVRPGRQSLARDGAEALLRGETGAGSGRIGKDTAASAAGLRSVTLAASSRAFPALLLSVNQEGGRLNAIDWPDAVQLPGSMALGAAGDEALAGRAGAAIGGQLKAAGLTWNLAPVCDLAAWPSERAVGTRAFGSDPAQVAVLAAAFVRGLQTAGVAATAKHFPGLGGTAADPHQQAPVIDELPAGALAPFRAAVHAGVACVMAGSHTVRAVEDRPALASRQMIALLREDLGFGGVVVTENLSIPAVHEPLGGLARAAVAAVAAGADVVMLDSEISRGRQPHRQRAAAIRTRGEVAGALAAAVEAGLISRDRVAEAAGRVLALHRRFGIAPGTPFPGWAEADSAAGKTAARIAEESVAVVRGAGLLPLALEPGMTLAAVRVPDAAQRRADSARHAPDRLPGLLGAWFPVQPVPAGGSLPPGTGPVVVYGYDTRDGSGARSGAAAAAARLGCQQRVVAQVAFGDPDDLAGSPADVLIAAFSPHHASAEAVARVLSGRLRARGAVPVGEAAW